MNIALGVVAALVLLGTGTFALFVAWGWFLEFCGNLDGLGAAAWMAGSLSVFLPLAFALLVGAGVVFFMVSGVQP